MDGTVASQENAMRGAAVLINRLMGQMLNGCGNTECRETLCHTGLLNMSHKPVRKPTPRTVRAFALALANTSNLENHLCCHYDDAREFTSYQEGPRDPSSLIQLLCDTSIIRALPDSLQHVQLDFELQELQEKHERLSTLLRAAGYAAPLPAEGFVDNGDLVNSLVDVALKWLIEKLPLTRAAPWIMVNRDVVSRGLAYPQKTENMPTDDSYNPWLAILDVLNHKPYLRLLQATMTVVGRRTELEDILYEQDAEHDKYPRPGTYPIACLLANALHKFVAGKETEPPQLGCFAFAVWLKRLLAEHWNAQPTFGSGGVVHGTLEVLRHLHMLLDQDMQASVLPTEALEAPFIALQVDQLTMAETYLVAMADDSSSKHHVIAWPMLFSMRHLSIYFRTMNHLVMRSAHSKADVAVVRRGKSGFHLERDDLPDQVRSLEEHYLLLSVSRDDILRDLWDQLWQRRKGELRLPLRVRLGEANDFEIGHDLGGVQIEFFNLVCKEVLAEDAQMFTTDRRSGISYFAPGSLQPLYMFELFGLLVALAIYNGITLPIRLPKVFYMLLASNASSECLKRIVSRLQLHDLDDLWTRAAASLESVLQEDVPGLEFAFPIESNGVRLSVMYPDPTFGGSEFTLQVVNALPADTIVPASSKSAAFVDAESFAWPGWRVQMTETTPTEVTSENKRQYVQHYINHLVYASVAPQLDAFLRGFRNADLFHYRTLQVFLPDQLQSHVEGSDHLDIEDLKSATRYDGYDKNSTYIRNFWRIVASWPTEKQKQLLKFVTAAERIPITGAAQLTFIIKKSNPQSLESLPTSSTCFGTLMLPKYDRPSVLATKLDLALRYGSEGFGTG